MGRTVSIYICINYLYFTLVSIKLLSSFQLYISWFGSGWVSILQKQPTYSDCFKVFLSSYQQPHSCRQLTTWAFYILEPLWCGMKLKSMQTMLGHMESLNSFIFGTAWKTGRAMNFYGEMKFVSISSRVSKNAYDFNRSNTWSFLLTIMKRTPNYPWGKLKFWKNSTLRTAERSRWLDLHSDNLIIFSLAHSVIMPKFHPEYGRYMLESTPGAPYTGSIPDLLSVEKDMRYRSVPDYQQPAK